MKLIDDDEVRRFLAGESDFLERDNRRKLRRETNWCVKSLEELGTVDVRALTPEERADHRRTVVNTASLLVATFPAVLHCLRGCNADVGVYPVHIAQFLREADWDWQEPKKAAKKGKG